MEAYILETDLPLDLQISFARSAIAIGCSNISTTSNTVCEQLLCQQIACKAFHPFDLLRLLGSGTTCLVLGSPRDTDTSLILRKFVCEFHKTIILTDSKDVGDFCERVSHSYSMGEPKYDISALCPPNYRKKMATKVMNELFEADSIIKSKINESKKSCDCTVLVVGSGGREHAIAGKLAESNIVSKVYVTPGNGGTNFLSDDPVKSKISNVEIVASLSHASLKRMLEEETPEHVEIAEFAVTNQVSLVVVGPEIPLANGLCDTLRRRGVLCFGPSAKAANIEASKAWSKDFMQRNNIPTAKFRNFTDLVAATEYITTMTADGSKVVIKASGLAAGKGVILPITTEDAILGATEIIQGGAFGSAGNEIVVEEFLEGEEVSVLAFCDGVTAVTMPGAQDHKRIFDGDKGPNTGGMGAYAPAPVLTPDLQRTCAQIIQDTVRCMAAEGSPFEGVLYAGFMITKNGPQVLEYNCRFGDPETQVLLPLLASDLFEVMVACAERRLHPTDVEWKKNTYACTVVCAASGYPGNYPKGDAITLSSLSGVQAKIGKLASVDVLHAGTSLAAGKLVTSGGRVVACTGTAPTLRAAVRSAYAAVRTVSFPGKQFRKDIAHRALDSPVRIGVIGSTRGSSLQPVLDAILAGQLNAKIVVCVSNKKDAPILARAVSYGVPVRFVPARTGSTREAYDRDVTAVFEEYSVDLVLMVGYMRIVSAAFVNRWNMRCLNVHPSLLPDFAGGMDLAVHQAVIDSDKTKSGCTVHFITEQVDGGPIALQLECPVERGVTGDTAETLKVKVQALEGSALIQAIELFRVDAIGPGSLCAISDDEHAHVLTYRAAGVDIDAGEALVQAIKPMCKSTRRAGCDADLGGFGGLFDVAAAGYNVDDTVLVAGADGVGTKLKIAQAVGKHDTIGIDLVAMNVNDILVCGAEPLFFLDYYATGALSVQEAAQVVSGIAEGCRQSRAGLIGGETAEMSGMYAKGEYDLAGFAVGAVRKGDILPRDIRSGDVLLGLPSSGVHSNGFSLVRKCVEKSGLKWSDPCPYQAGCDLATALLCPTKIYVKSLMPLIKQKLLKGMAHITGGGLLDNVPRVLPTGSVALVNIDKSGWTLPPVFKWLQGLANLPQEELLRTFNCGLGMVLVVAKEDAEQVMSTLRTGIDGEDCIDPYFLGEIIDRNGDEPQVKVIGEIR